jgi:acetylornithine deacetylase/succinyl-diaminopimelate desuccinylase-like protein
MGPIAPPPRGRPNVWGLRKCRSGADTLLLVGHTDTVHVRGWSDRWAGPERESPFSGALVNAILIAVTLTLREPNR